MKHVAMAASGLCIGPSVPSEGLRFTLVSTCHKPVGTLISTRTHEPQDDKGKG